MFRFLLRLSCYAIHNRTVMCMKIYRNESAIFSLVARDVPINLHFNAANYAKGCILRSKRNFCKSTRRWSSQKLATLTICRLSVWGKIYQTQKRKKVKFQQILNNLCIFLLLHLFKQNLFKQVAILVRVIGKISPKKRAEFLIKINLFFCNIISSAMVRKEEKTFHSGRTFLNSPHFNSKYEKKGKKSLFLAFLFCCCRSKLRERKKNIEGDREGGKAENE